ncbi:MAG: hypothetical protein HOC20_10055 [Chloroflexi bacterium]|jgi:hypothetical protein|nr:hypothetical protein [Chloroflexota bacterium]
MAWLQWIKWTKRLVRWGLLIVTFLYVITGFGITEYQTVESLTFGVLDKVQSFKIHTSLEIPFISLLVLHIFISPVLRLYFKFKKGVPIGTKGI